MSSALKYSPRYTVDDYRMWKGDWELWDGIAIAMSPSPFGRHQAILIALASEFRNAIRRHRCEATILGELDWVIREDTVVRPDLVIVCGDAPEKHLHDSPALVAEILSPSTRKNDLTYKRELYEREGIGTYLIVDPETKQIEQLTLSDQGAYGTTSFQKAIQINLCDDCDIELSADEVFA